MPGRPHQTLLLLQRWHLKDECFTGSNTACACRVKSQSYREPLKPVEVKCTCRLAAHPSCRRGVSPWAAMQCAPLKLIEQCLLVGRQLKGVLDRRQRVNVLTHVLEVGRRVTAADVRHMRRAVGALAHEAPVQAAKPGMFLDVLHAAAADAEPLTGLGLFAQRAGRCACEPQKRGRKTPHQGVKANGLALASYEDGRAQGWRKGRRVPGRVVESPAGFTEQQCRCASAPIKRTCSRPSSRGASTLQDLRAPPPPPLLQKAKHQVLCPRPKARPSLSI
eukprot:363924-Chlamydomonas_euryale.AAC.2